MRVPPSGFDDSAFDDPAPSGASSTSMGNAGLDASQLSPNEQARLARHVMRRQGALSMRVAAVFVVLLLGLPLANLYSPGLGSLSVLGFPLTWLFLGVLFYPITVLLSIYFVRHSDRIEAETAQSMGAQITPNAVGREENLR